MHPIRQSFPVALLIAAALLGAARPPEATASSLVPRSTADLAAAPRVVVADLESAQSRWNLQGTLIVTDYRFRTVEALRGAFGETFTITQGGGTVGDETHQLSDLPVYRPGGRYVLAMEADDNPVFSPVRFGAAGVLVVDRGSGRFLGAVPGGADLQVFRDLVARTPVAGIETLVPARSGGDALPAKRYERTVHGGPLAWTEPAGQAALPGPRGASPAVGLAQPADLLALVVPRYTVQRRPAPPIVFNPLPLDWVWSPSDQNMMADWNRYGDVFRVLTTPTGNWAWGNNRYDLAGFPSNADMVAQFGAGWGATTLAICWSRWFGDGPIVESDIAVNPAFGWTLDDEFGTRDESDPWSFRQTMQHELGHAWGLQHPFEHADVWWPSTMNYGPKWSRTPTLHSDDTGAIRWAYPGRTLHDGALVAWRTQDATGTNHAAHTEVRPSPAVVLHGAGLSFSAPATLQNLGTTTLVNPAIDLYLAPTRMSWTGAVYIGRSSYTTTVAPFPSSIALLDLGTHAIPATTPTGVYVPAFYLVASGGTDASGGNDSAWARDVHTVTVRNVTQVLLPTTTLQLAPVGRIGPSGQWTFRFDAVAGAIYELSTCGNAAFDTVITLSAPGGGASNDDACGLQSRVRWTSTANQSATVVVRGYSGAAQGEFRLAYRREPEAVFGNGFED